MGLAQEIRSQHRQQVLWTAYAAGTISRADLSRRLNLTKPSISAIVDELIGHGLLKEVGRGPVGPRGGRQPVHLQVNARARCAIGVDVRRDKLTVLLADLRGAILRRRVEAASPEASADAVIEQVLHACRDLLRRTPRAAGRVLGAGIGTIGPVDSVVGMVRRPLRFAGGADVPFRARLEAALRVPVTVDVGSNAAAFGEMVLGAARGRRSLVYVTLGHGIGSGIVLDGHIHRSLASFGLGHTSVDLDGPVCSCGNHGCLELYASTDAVAERIRALAREGRFEDVMDTDRMAGDEVYAWLADRVRRADTAATEVLRDLARRIAGAMRNIVNLLGPELLIVGSSHPYLVDMLVPLLEIEIADLNACQSHRRRVELLPALLKENSIALGAAMMVVHRFLRGSEGIGANGSDA